MWKKILKEVMILLFSIILFETTGFYAYFLIWFAFIPIIYLVYSTPWKRAIIYSIIFGFSAPAILFYWIGYYSLSIFFSSLILVSSFYYLFPMITKFLMHKIKYPWNILSAPIVWISLQWLYSLSAINSFWADASLFQPMLAPLIWWIKGSGITFLILFVNSICVFYILKKDKRLLVALFFIFVVILLSFSYSYFSSPKGQPVKVALIQQNDKQSWEWKTRNAGAIFEKLKNLTLEAAKEQPDLIVWPEYSIPIEINDTLFSQISQLANETNAYLILGSIKEYDEYYNKKRRFQNDIVLLFSPDGAQIGTYKSVKPLLFEKWILPGDKPGLFEANGNKFGLLICYEETQGALAKDLSDSGARFFISISNNQHFRDSQGLKLSSLHMRLHSTENAKYLIRSTNTGLTQVINPYGKVQAELKPNTKGVLITVIYI